MAADARLTLRGLVRVGQFIHQLEFELCGFADERFQGSGVVKPRNLNYNPIIALADDRWFKRSKRVDAAINNVLGCVHRLIKGRFVPCTCWRDNQPIAIVDADIPIAAARGIAG